MKKSCITISIVCMFLLLAACGSNNLHGRIEETLPVSEPPRPLPTAPKPTPKSGSEENLEELYSIRAGTFEQAESGEYFNRYLDELGNVHWYYDDTIDESMTELMSDYVNSGNLYSVMDMAIAYGINPYIYTSTHEGEKGYVSGSDVP